MKKSKQFVGNIYELNFDKAWGEVGKKADYYDHYVLKWHVWYFKWDEKNKIDLADQFFYILYFYSPSDSFIQFSNRWDPGK